TRGRGLVEGSLAVFSDVGGKRGIASSVFLFAGILFSSQGDRITIYSRLEESLTFCRELREKGCMAHTLGILGQVTLDQGDATKARVLSEESLALNREIGDRWEMIQSLCLLAEVEALQDYHVAARSHYEESL